MSGARLVCFASTAASSSGDLSSTAARSPIPERTSVTPGAAASGFRASVSSGSSEATRSTRCSVSITSRFARPARKPRVSRVGQPMAEDQLASLGPERLPDVAADQDAAQGQVARR